MYHLTVHVPEKSYPIYIKKGLLFNVGKEIKEIYKNKKIAIVTDDNVDKYHGETLKNTLTKEGFTVSKITVPHGEASKSMGVLTKVFEGLLNAQITRGDLIIAFGGGVVGDLAGFAASTFLRGVPFVQIPTTLLAQVDSSVGGKVAVDLPQGKNLVGSFYHPKAVFIDPSLLGTLEEKYFLDGMGEVIKYGAIKDEALFNRLLTYEGEKALKEDIEDIIYRCCTIKSTVVEMDEKDTGERMLLNFGHTLGHAIEQAYFFEKYSHGEAVAIGMYHMALLGESIGVTKEQTAIKLKDILEKYHLPWELPDIDDEVLLKAVNHDKKNIGAALNFILLKKIGDSLVYSSDIKKMGEYLKNHRINVDSI